VTAATEFDAAETGPLPETGADWETLAAEMRAMAAGDADWRNLKTAVYVFNAGDEARRVGREAYTMFMAENGLAPKHERSHINPKDIRQIRNHRSAWVSKGHR